MTSLAQRIRSSQPFGRDRLALIADVLAVALAVALPWSTSATQIFAGLLLVVIIATLDRPQLNRVLATPAGGLPIVLLALGIAGMLWATDATIAERLDAVKPYLKLLLIPLLIVQFSRSRRGGWVMIGFLASCGVLLALSWILVARWALSPELRFFPVLLFGIPVRDYIAQSGEFTLCIFLLAKLALDDWRAGHNGRAFAYWALAAAFLANILYVATSRTMLVVIPVLLLVFAWRQLPRKTMIAVVMAGVVIGGAAWVAAPPVRTNVTGAFSEMQEFQPGDPNSRAGLRMEFWRKSMEFIAAAPIIGHGTGSRLVLYQAPDRNGVAVAPTVNPHNQILAVAIRLGLVGTAVLVAFWLSHLMLFCGSGLAAWAGLVIVIQNVVGSLFNSHLFDFSQGWLYVIGVGVAAGTVLRTAAAHHPL
jgi:O-antigen ligase